MSLLLTIGNAQRLLVDNARARRLARGFTQAGLAKRSGVSLASVRKFEQKGIISLTAFLKIMMVLGAIEQIVAASAPEELAFSSIDEVLEAKPVRKKGWRS